MFKPKTNFLLLVIVCAHCITTAQVKINPMLMGQSYHYTTWSNLQSPNIFSGQSAVWPYVEQSGAVLVRAGGNSYNVGQNHESITFNAKPGFNDQMVVRYVDIVDDIRRNGCEPVITLPFQLNEYPDLQEESEGPKEKELFYLFPVLKTRAWYVWTSTIKDISRQEKVLSGTVMLSR